MGVTHLCLSPERPVCKANALAQLAEYGWRGTADLGSLPTKRVLGRVWREAKAEPDQAGGDGHDDTPESKVRAVLTPLTSPFCGRGRHQSTS